MKTKEHLSRSLMKGAKNNAYIVKRSSSLASYTVEEPVKNTTT